MANLKDLIVNGVSRFIGKVYINDSSIGVINGSTVGSNPKFTDNNTTYAAATTSAAGLMSSTDKAKLDGIATGAQANTITGVKGNAESSYRTGNVNLTPANIGALPTSGGTMTGQVKWSGLDALPQTTSAQYLVSIDAFAEGGTQKWIRTGDTLVGKATNDSDGNAINTTYLKKSGGTMTGQLKTSFKQSVATGCYQAVATTIPDLCEQLRFSSGCMGSFYLGTAYTKGDYTLSVTWYNFLWIPHRSGGINGVTSGDNCNYGSLYLTGMNGNWGKMWLINYSGNAIQQLKEITAIPANIPANNIAEGYLNTHPQNSPILVPFIHNDIAFLTERGGSISATYDGNVMSYDFFNAFDGSGSYVSVSSSTYSTLVIEITCHKTFTWTNRIYIDFGSVSWRAKSVTIDVMNSNYSEDTWSTKYNTTTNSSGHVYVGFSHTPTGASNSGGGFNKIRFTLSSWNSTDRRIAQIGVYNYGSSGVRETYMSRGIDDAVYRNITPAKNSTYDLGSSSYKWRNIYGNLTGDVTGTATKATSDASGNNISNTYMKKGVDYVTAGQASGSTLGTKVTAEGYNVVASSSYAHAEGNATTASGQSAHAEGYHTLAYGNYSHAEGYDSQAYGSYSHAEGNASVADSGNAHAEGNATTASGSASHAEGYETIALGNYSHAQGMYSQATGSVSHAEGKATIASGSEAHAEGNETEATGNYSHAQGDHCKATTYATHAEGYYTIASGQDSHAQGNQTTASGDGSHAEGYKTLASTVYAHAEGNISTASGNNSHAQGAGTLASGTNAHAEGLHTVASGLYAHAEGDASTASGSYSHAEGLNTIAQRQSQHVFGEYNVADTSGTLTSRGTYVEIVGKGTSTTRSNARTLDWSGNEVLAGKLTVGTGPSNNMDVATKQYVDGKALTYTLSISSNTITLTGSNGSTSTATLPVYTGGVS